MIKKQVNIPEPLDEQIRALAGEKGISYSEMVRRLIEEGLHEVTRYELVQESN